MFYFDQSQPPIFTEIDGIHGKKKLVENHIYLDIVKKLYSRDLIEKFGEKIEKVKKSEELIPINGFINEETSRNLESLIRELEFENFKEKESNVQKQDEQISDGIDWHPPSENWNPWKSSEIMDSYRYLSMDEKSEYIKKRNIENIVEPQMKEIRESLPIYNSRKILLDAIKSNTVVIVKGETGSGKTTQLPQYILEDAIENGQGMELN